MTDKTLNKYINDAGALDLQIKELEKTLKAMKEKIIDAMKESDLTDRPTAKFNAHLSHTERKSIDTSKLKKDNPDIWENLFTEYPKISAYDSVKFTAI